MTEGATETLGTHLQHLDQRVHRAVLRPPILAHVQASPLDERCDPPDTEFPLNRLIVDGFHPPLGFSFPDTREEDDLALGLLAKPPLQGLLLEIRVLVRMRARPGEPEFEHPLPVLLAHISILVRALAGQLALGPPDLDVFHAERPTPLPDEPPRGGNPDASIDMDHAVEVERCGVWEATCIAVSESWRPRRARRPRRAVGQPHPRGLLGRCDADLRASWITVCAVDKSWRVKPPDRYSQVAIQLRSNNSFTLHPFFLIEP